MSDSYLPALKAIKARLESQLSVDVHTNVPQNEQFPYVVISIETGDDSTMDNDAMIHEVQVSVFSRESSPFEAANIASQAYDALNRQEDNITLDSGSLTYLHFQGTSDIFKEPDDKTWQAVRTYNMRIE